MTQYDLDNNFTETALIALTWIEAAQSSDQETAIADQALMLQTYGMETIQKGALLTLSVMLALNAYVSRQDFKDRIQTERDNIREELSDRYDHEAINIALTYIGLDQNEDRAKATADKSLVIDTYGKQYIYDGVMLTLTVMLQAQAHNLDVSFRENADRVRRIMRDSMRFEPGD